jgi:hypothetical protein
MASFFCASGLELFYLNLVLLLKVCIVFNNFNSYFELMRNILVIIKVCFAKKIAGN